MLKASHDLSSFLIDILQQETRTPHKLHNALVEILEKCKGMNKKDIIECRELNLLFSAEYKLVDRNSVVTWIHSYSPIRISLHSSGAFRKISWKKKKPYLWDLEGARNTDWDLFYKGYLKRKEAAEIRKAIAEQELAADKQISDYLRRNPVKENQAGKFGVPQDKYRWGFYGHKTFEYDVWGRNEK